MAIPPNATPLSAMEAYFRFEDKIKELTALIDEDEWVIQTRTEIAQLEEKKRNVEAFLLKHCSQNGVSKVSTEAGEFIKEDKVHYNLASYEQFCEWMSKQDEIPFHFFNKKLTGKSIDEFAEQNDGQLPPGISTFVKTTPKFKRKDK